MAKSKNNGVDPEQIIANYGADTARLFMLFAAPPEQSLEWSDAGIEGAHRFLRRLWKYCADHVNQGLVTAYQNGELNPELKALRYQLHGAINKISDDYGRRQTFNTAIATVMELLNSLYKVTDTSAMARSVVQETLERMTIMLAPIVPHICTAIWDELSPGTTLSNQRWPVADPTALIQEQMTLIIQVNGKLRGELNIAKSTDQASIEQLALNLPAIQKFITGQVPRKIIVVPGRLVNIVV